MTQHIWHGVDGSTWNMNADGPVPLMAGTSGQADPKVQVFGRTAPALDGFRMTGLRFEERRVFWPVEIAAPSSLEWVAKRRAFMASFSYEETGTWEVINDDGETRTLELRLGVQDEQFYNIDPPVSLYELLGIELVADDPWWKGPEIVQQFQTAGVETPFFEPNPTHVLNIMSSNTVASASISNPGDVDAWAEYLVNGPATAFSVTIDDGTVAGSIVVPTGEVLTVDTRPTAQVAMISTSSSPVTRDLSQVDWRPVPKGESVDLDVVLNGTGSIIVRIVPRYLRGW